MSMSQVKGAAHKKPEPVAPAAAAERVQMKKAVQGKDGFAAQSSALSPNAPVQMFAFGVKPAASISLGGQGGAGAQTNGPPAQQGGGGSMGGGGFFGINLGGAPIAKTNGTDGKTITALQTKLAGLGFYKGSIDGLIGPKTTQAVKDFQAANGLTPDGIVGPKTQAALHATTSAGPGNGFGTGGDASAKSDTPAPQPTNQPAPQGKLTGGG